jgi:hypothetical protein
MNAKDCLKVFFEKKGKIINPSSRHLKMVCNIRIGKCFDFKGDVYGMDLYYQATGFNDWERERVIGLLNQCFKLGIPMENSLGIIMVWLEKTEGYKFPVYQDRKSTIRLLSVFNG